MATQATASPDDALANDARLKAHVTYRRRATTIAETLKTLTAQTGVKLIPVGVELGITDLTCAYEDVPLRDLLDSLSRVRNFVWKRRKDNALLLQNGYNEHRFDIYRPHTEAETEMWRQGKKFLDEYNKMSAEQRHDITYNRDDNSPHPGGYGVPVSNLSPAGQQAINGMFRAYFPEFADSHPQLDLRGRVNPNDISNLKVTVHNNKQEGCQFVHIGIGQPGSDAVLGFSLDMSFAVFDDPIDNVERIVPKSDNYGGGWEGDKEDAQSKRENGLSDPRLSKRVTLSLHRYSLYEALLEMKTQTGVDFTTQLLHPKDPARPFFSCTNMPLNDALDALCKAHGYADIYTLWKFTWGVRKSGVVLVHCTPGYLKTAPPVAPPRAPGQTARR